MATVTVIEKTNIDSSWMSYSLGSNNGMYVIAIKGAKATTDVFDVNDLKYITMDVGIDSGIKDKPLAISRLKLNFDEFTSDDVSLNKKTAFIRLNQLPTDIYLRVTSFADSTKEYKTGSMSISINIAKI